MDQPATLAWKHAASLIRVEDLPMVAAHLLAAGHDSPSLRDLAGRSRHEHPADIRELFGHTMEELGIQIPEYETAERCLLHHMATQLSAGVLSPKEAAARVWQGIATVTDPERKFVAAVGPEYLLDFMSPEEVRAWENAVRRAAKTLSATAFPHAQCPRTTSNDV
ncbi:hypothetical protein ACFU3O_20645 [Streptomyces antibioticus]|uniref:hypothetical protein n=1 Tax=Streptomyces antibioticus TaxID=1890 RepID=UPI003683C3E5